MRKTGSVGRSRSACGYRCRRCALTTARRSTSRAAAGGDGCVSLPPRGPRAQGRARRRRRRPRRRRRAPAATTRCATCSPSAARAHYKAPRAAATARARSATAPTATTLEVARAARHPSRRWDGDAATTCRARAAASSSRAAARGGRGNRSFATATRQAPRFAERGLPGEEGVDRAAASSCSPTSASSGCRTPASPRCWRGSRARAPKVADYPFTTLEPVLGTLEADDRQLVSPTSPG